MRDDKKLKLCRNILVVFSTGNEERPIINRSQGGLSMGPVVIEEVTILRLIQHLIPDKPSGPDDNYHRLMKDLADVMAEPMAMLFDMSL